MWRNLAGCRYGGEERLLRKREVVGGAVELLRSVRGLSLSSSTTTAVTVAAAQAEASRHEGQPTITSTQEGGRVNVVS